MDQSQIAIPPYLFYEVDRNNIGPEGCSFLSQAKLGDLSVIDLSYLCLKVGNNKVDDLACKFLSKANWINLKEIVLCTALLR